MLANNQFESLPPEIGELTALQELDLSGNRLASLPPNLDWLAELKRLTLGRDCLSLPARFEGGGIGAIRSYRSIAEFFADRSISEFFKVAVPLYEAKVVLVGEPDVGKTTLKERLVRGKFAIPKSTCGLELSTAEIEHPAVKGARITLNFWDFGGQEEYHPAQQLFFSKGALYLLLWHGRHNLEQARLERWLRLVSHRAGPDARVILVATHADDFMPTGNVSRLADEFPGMIAGFFAVDSKSGKGIDQLWEAVAREVQGLDGFGAEHPKAWIEARDAILGSRGEKTGERQQMPFEEFKAAAIKSGVAPEAVKIFATMLSSQGRIVYHGDDLALAGTVVLEPDWLMKAIAYVLKDDATKTNRGVLAQSRLAAIWRDHNRSKDENPFRYEEHQWGFLLTLMAQQNIIYRLSEREWFVPALAPAEPPANLPWDGRADQHGEPLRLECQLDDPLPGLMALLTVRNHFYHVDFHRYSWRTGVFLRDPYRGDEARIEERKGDTEVSIAVRGASKWRLMDHLASGLEQLIQEKWPAAAHAERKPYHFLIPCPTKGCGGHFDRELLLTDLKHGEKTAKCSDTRNRCVHPIHSLVPGLPMLSGLGEEAGLLYAEMRAVREQLDMLLRLNSSEAPRIYSLKPVNTRRFDPRQLLGQRIEIATWCEELKVPVEGATEIVTLNPAWVSHLRDYGPTLHKLVSTAAILGASVKAVRGVMTADLDKVREATFKIVDAIMHWEARNACAEDARDRWEEENRSGRLVENEFGRPVDPEVAKALHKAALNGKMKQISVNNVWRWVSPEIARRSDPSAPKER